MNRYYWHYPGMIYAGNWDAGNIKQAKKEIREYLGLKRLPNGFAIWKV